MSTFLNEELIIRCTMLVCREHLSISVCTSFPFSLESRVCDLIVIVPDHCLYFCLTHSYLEIRKRVIGKQCRPRSNAT